MNFAKFLYLLVIVSLVYGLGEYVHAALAALAAGFLIYLPPFWKATPIDDTATPNIQKTTAGDQSVMG
jgi:hypothetical protein